MTMQSPTSFAQIQQLYNRVNDYLRKNMSEIRNVAAAAFAASQAGNEALRQKHLMDLEKLKKSRLELLNQHAQVFALEMAYEASNRQPSDAERRLAEGVRSANSLIRSINGIADTLNKVAEFAGIITRLIGIFS